jgi:hypothetical protein
VNPSSAALVQISKMPVVPRALPSAILTSAFAILLACSSSIAGVETANTPRSEQERDSNGVGHEDGKASPESTAPEAPKKLIGATNQELFLSSIDTAVGPGVGTLVEKASDDRDLASKLRIRITVPNVYKELGELTSRSDGRLVNGAFYLSDLSELESHDRLKPQYRKSSFVIDFEEKSIADIEKTFRDGGSEINSANIASFIGKYIENKNYSRGFDIASRVAASKAGDCTEHAVLSVALSRRLGLPARLITGIVLVGTSGDERETHLRAVGHAWVEVHEGGKWQILDAALKPGDETGSERTGVAGLDPSLKIRIVYLPITRMDDESVSFARSMLDKPSVGSVVRIQVDSASSAPN